MRGYWYEHILNKILGWKQNRVYDYRNSLYKVEIYNIQLGLSTEVKGWAQWYFFFLRACVCVCATFLWCPCGTIHRRRWNPGGHRWRSRRNSIQVKCLDESSRSGATAEQVSGSGNGIISGSRRTCTAQQREREQIIAVIIQWFKKICHEQSVSRDSGRCSYDSLTKRKKKGEPEGNAGMGHPGTSASCHSTKCFSAL